MTTVEASMTVCVGNPATRLVEWEPVKTRWAGPSGIEHEYFMIGAGYSDDVQRTYLVEFWGPTGHLLDTIWVTQ